MQGITIDGKHSLRDFHLILESMNIGHPEPKTSYIDVPGRNGRIDATDYLIDMPVFGNRELGFNFALDSRKVPKKDWELWRSKLLNAVHGKKCRITLDSTPSWYYVGRVTLEAQDDDGSTLRFGMKVDANPYQCSTFAESGNWKWDELNFIDGSIYNHTFEVAAGTTEIRVPNCRMPVIPEITANKSIKLEYKNKTYDIQANTKTIKPAIVLVEGWNSLKVIATEKTAVNIDFGVGKL